MLNLWVMLNQVVYGDYLNMITILLPLPARRHRSRLNCAGLCPITESACLENVSAPGVAQISVKAGFIRKT